MLHFKKLTILAFFSIFVFCIDLNAKEQYGRLPHVSTLNEAISLFPTNSEQIEIMIAETCEHIQIDTNEITKLIPEERTYQNTVQALDAIYTNAGLAGAKLAMVDYLSNDPSLKQIVNKAHLQLQNVTTDCLGQNKKLYQSLKDFSNLGASKQILTLSEQSFLDNILLGFERCGLNLPEAVSAQSTLLKKEIMSLSIDFNQAINNDNSFIEVALEDLSGLEQDFIDSLKKSNDHYILGVDYPTYNNVLENCSCATTRKKLWSAFCNRGVEHNLTNLQSLIQKRQQRAQLLEYRSFADLDIEDQMAQSPERVDYFLKDISSKVQNKAAEEYRNLVRELPQNMTINAEGKIAPWDFPYLVSSYKKKIFSLDERTVAEYFPMAKTIEGLLSIYQQFFSLTFIEHSVSGLWDPEVKCIEIVQTEDQKLLGYLFLDLLPRKNKYTHACHLNVLPAITDSSGISHPAISIVIANFAKPTLDKPSLLNRTEVVTFFHEFGHALHAFFGSTQFGTLSGTKVHKDFVELPSQMLESWMWEPEIIKKISSHYLTNQPMPDEMIKSIIDQQNLISGMLIQRQIFFSLFALEIHKKTFDGNFDALAQRLYAQAVPHIAFGADNHFYASFGHLTGYGSKYYGYLWSKVFALDLFEHIKEHGLLNAEIGAEYKQKILSKGGTEDPNDLLRDFLGREPNGEAFMRSLGLSD